MLLRWENSSWISLKTVSAARRTCYLKPIRILVTEGTRADCKEAVHLIEGISAETLLADRGYDTNDILAYAVSAGMEPVIPPKKNRKERERPFSSLRFRAVHPHHPVAFSMSLPVRVDFRQQFLTQRVTQKLLVCYICLGSAQRSPQRRIPVQMLKQYYLKQYHWIDAPRPSSSLYSGPTISYSFSNSTAASTCRKR